MLLGVLGKNQLEYTLLKSKASHLNVENKVGQRYSFDLKKKQLAGLISLVMASVVLIFAVVLVSGVFGIGKMAFVASGLTIASMLGFGIAAYLLLSKSNK